MVEASVTATGHARRQGAGRCWMVTLFLAVFFGSASAALATDQIIVGGSNFDYDTVNPSRTTLLGFQDWSAANTDRLSIVPDAGTVSALRVVLENAPSPGSRVTFTLRIDTGAGPVATALTCLITNNETSCSDTDPSHSVAVAPGDKLDLQATPTRDPVPGHVHYTTRYVSTSAADNTLLLGGSPLSPLSYISLHAQGTYATAFPAETVFPAAGTLKSLYVALPIAPGAGQSRTFTVVRNGVSTALTCTIADAATTCSDTVNQVPFTAGDTAALQHTESASPAAVVSTSNGVVFEPGASDAFLIAMGTDRPASTAATRFSNVASGGRWAGGTEDLLANELERHQLAQATTVRTMIVEMTPAPDNGAGVNGYQFTLRQNGADTGLLCTIAESATTCSAGLDVAIADDDLLSLEITPIGNPTQNSGFHATFCAGGVGSCPPILTTTGAASVNGGDPFTLYLSASFCTPTSWTINWGDGAIETFAGNPASVTHTYDPATQSTYTHNILASVVCGGNTYFQNDLVVPSGANDRVNWYAHDGATNLAVAGAPAQSGPDGLDFPTEAVVGPDGDVYVSGFNTSNVVRYNPATGAFIDVFVTAGSGGLSAASGMAFGPDGHLYVASYSTSEVLRYNGTTGAFIDDFVTAGLGGLDRADGLVFGPDGNLYVSDSASAVYRYDGSTGAFIDQFVATGSGGLDNANDLVFGPDGNLYVASDTTNSVLRYDGSTGAFIDTFVAPGNGLAAAEGVAFGPDGRFYVASDGDATVKRYSGTTGAYIDDYVAAGLGGLSGPEYFDFLPGHQVVVVESSTSGLHLIYGTNDSHPDTPRVRTLASAVPSWDRQAVTVATSTNVNWIVSAQGPTRDEEIAVVFSDAPRIDAIRWNGTAWSSEWASTAGLVAANATRRGIAVAYERTSGDAMVVYTNNSANPQYRTWNGTTWSGAANVFAIAPGTGEVRWVELASDPTTNRIALVYSDGLNDVHAAVWDGTAWDQATRQTLTTTGANGFDYRDVDLAYEASGDLLVVHAEDNGFDWWTMAAGTTTWVDGGHIPLVNGLIAYVEVAAEPGSDRIALVAVDENTGTERLGAATWTGAAWFNDGEYVTGVPHWETDGPGPFWAAVQWRGTAGEAVIAFSDFTAGELGWASWTDTASGWVVQPDEVVPGMTPHIRSLQLEVLPGFDRIIAAFSDEDGDLRSAGYGGTWDFQGVLNAELTSAQYKPFALAPPIQAAAAVELVSFTALGLDGAVELEWETATEMDNLGFHLDRSLSPQGPWERITASLIPGLGSSPEGARYGYRDGGLQNGVTYFYRLEDVETTGRTERHGPVSALPRAGSEPPPDEEPLPEEGHEPGPAWVTYGDPQATSLRVVKRDKRGVTVELLTGGFFAVPEPDGEVWLEIPGFENGSEPGEPAIPVARSWVEAVVGRKVRLGKVKAGDVVAFSSLRPVASGAPELMEVDGTLRPALRRRPRGKAFKRPGLFPEEAARVLETAFQGETKKALLELSPLRWDRSSGELLLARRLTARLKFAGREPGERSRGGSRGRAYRGKRGKRGPRGEGVVARVWTRQRGLYAVTFEDLFGPGGRAVSASDLRLSRQGEAVGFHLEPDDRRFSRGSVLYFVGQDASVNPYGPAAVYEVSLERGGVRMPVDTASPRGAALGHYWQHARWEQNLRYQPGALQTSDPWLWDAVVSPGAKSYSLAVRGLAPSSEPAWLRVWLLGGSDFGVAPDHHLRLYVNEFLAGEASWDGKNGQQIEALIPPGVLLEGDNDLRVENVGDTGAQYSLVFLDRYALSYPRVLAAEAGVLEGSFRQFGEAELTGLASGAALLDVSQDPPRWLSGDWGTGLRFYAEAEHSYLAVSPEAVLKPEVRPATRATLESPDNGAEYLLLAPREFLGLDSAAALLEQRRAQGLSARGVAIEDVFDEFGHGEASPEAVKEFLSYAYHFWPEPSLRYVLLLGDATYDPKDYLGTGTLDRVPAYPLHSTLLATVSDPAYAAVNGDDLLPDLAIGRLPAASPEEARVMIDKVLAYEAAGLSLDGATVLVADNSDHAGSFEADAEWLAAGVLAERDLEKIYLSRLGAATRPTIVDAFDRGASLMSYMGHGAILLWASENVFNFNDVATLSPQPQQPLVMMMNCLNGYFHYPYLDSLGEALVKVEGKGAIATFSPSGMSMNGPANVYHQALLAEIVSGHHQRLGDAVLAAQVTYAETGASSELLSLYHLFGDPALMIR